MRMFEGFIPPKLHDHFVEQLHRCGWELNGGMYDACTPVDGVAFGNAYNPLINDIIDKLIELGIFKNGQTLAPTLEAVNKDGWVSQTMVNPEMAGDTVAVASFNSPIVLTFSSLLKKEEHKVFIPPRSLYVLTKEARNEWFFAIHPGETTYNGKPFERSRRFAMIISEPGPRFDNGARIITNLFSIKKT